MSLEKLANKRQIYGVVHCKVTVIHSSPGSVSKFYFHFVPVCRWPAVPKLPKLK